MITHKTGEAFSASTLNKIKTIDGIAVIAGSLERVVNLPPNFYGKNSTVTALSLVGIDPTIAPELHDYRITQGRFLEPGDGTVAVISERLADSLGVKLNDSLKLPTTQGVVKLTIVGLVPGRALIGNEQVLVTLTAGAKTAGHVGPHQRDRSESHDQRQGAKRSHRQYDQSATGEHVHARRAVERLGICSARCRWGK